MIDLLPKVIKEAAGKVKKMVLGSMEELYTEVSARIRNIDILTECAICVLSLNDYTPKVKLKCGHNKFHHKCLLKWLEKDQNCPMCRTKIDKLGVD